MRKIGDIRRENLRNYVDALGTGGTTKVAKTLGYKNASFLSQQIGPKPTREITEKSAREYEQGLGLAPGFLDTDHSVAPPPPADAVEPLTVQLMADVIRLVGSVAQMEDLQLGPQRFADLARLALVDAVEHEGKPRETYVRQVAQLLK